jgi:integrase
MAAMGRRRSRNHGLPPHMAQKGATYYYVTNDKPRRWISLGRDYVAALGEWAKLEGQPAPETARTFGQIAAWYEAKIVPKKALRTQRDNRAELKRLVAVFGESVIDTIEPTDVKRYIEDRVSLKKRKEGEEPAAAPVRANREISLLSHIINWARERGLTKMANPCAGVGRNKETGRERYIDDAEYDAIYTKADPVLRDALDLLLFTGQRPGDVLKMKRADIKDGCLWVRQGKTRHQLRISDEADLAAALERMLTRERTATGLTLVQDDAGQPLTYWMLEGRWAAARAAAGLPDVQMRDLRGKAATDVEDLAHAQQLLGHASRAMTERYVKQRAGVRVAPNRRKKA